MKTPMLNKRFLKSKVPSWSLLLGARHSALRSWFLAPGSWFPVPGSLLGAWLIVLGAWLMVPGACFAASSTNYSLVEDRFTGGGGNASSTNYQIAETAVELLGQASMSSSNYAAQSQAGIQGTQIATISSVSPSSYGKFFSDSSASFTVSAIDPNGSSLQYSAKQDSTTKVPAQSSNVLSWNLSSADLGRHTITLNVIDPDGTVSTQTADYVVRRPVK